MATQLSVRIASAVGFLALAGLFVGIDPFLSVGATSSTPAFSVNRDLKGDRLPLRPPTVIDVPDWQPAGRQPSGESRVQTPFACDPAISLIRSPRSPRLAPDSAMTSANVYRRCMA